MSIFRFFSEGQESDPRVLKAQLALTVTTARNVSFTSPVLAVACAVLCSTGLFGHVSLASTSFLPLAVATATGASVLMAVAYQRYNDSEGDVGSWLQCFVMVQAFGSFAWGLMPWLCWDKHNILNHTFLMACVMAVVAGLVVARGSNMRMYIANLLPLSLMTAARFLLGDSYVDMVMGAVVPFMTFQMWRMGRPVVLRMGEDARLRFKIEDMAGELEVTRDEALRKRDEAETANAKLTVVETAIRTLLDNAEQGFLTVGEDLTVGEQSSAACEAMLGEALAGKPIVELLCRDLPQDAVCAMRDTLASVFRDSGDYASDYIRELKLELLPAAFELGGKSIRAGYKMLDGNRLMLILTDVTETTRLAAQVERERLRLEMIVLAFTESEAFTALVEEYRTFLDAELPSLLEQIAAPGKVSELYRRIHTFKGLLAQFSFHGSPHALHGFETLLSEKSGWTAHEAREIFQADRLRTAFQRDLDGITGLLGPDFLSPGRLAPSQAQLQALKGAATDALAKDAPASPAVRRLLRELAGLGGLDVKSQLTLHGRGVGALAERLEKQMAAVEVEGDATSLMPQIYGPFLRSLVHVFRNAIDHGIEAPDARLAAGKPAEGNIRCRVRYSERGLDISIEDDGHGIDRERLEQHLAGSGATSSQAAQMPLEELMFRQGLSSRDSADEISGRGVGLAAVKEELDRLGGTVRVETLPGAGTRFHFHLPVDTGASGRASLEMIA
ncbi:MAG TPA: ATP-binding protein [Rhizomicrobium sp.]|nr:ATP-binding protein [Rhizomicrobium sp.]